MFSRPRSNPTGSLNQQRSFQQLTTGSSSSTPQIPASSTKYLVKTRLKQVSPPQGTHTPRARDGHNNSRLILERGSTHALENTRPKVGNIYVLSNMLCEPFSLQREGAGESESLGPINAPHRQQRIALCSSESQVREAENSGGQPFSCLPFHPESPPESESSEPLRPTITGASNDPKNVPSPVLKPCKVSEEVSDQVDWGRVAWASWD